MIDPDRVLQPLKEEEGAIGRLDTYTSPAELADAVVAVRDAVDRSLRLLLRNDPGAPDELRLKALSAKDLPHHELLPALRRRELISLALAGSIHGLEQAADRAVADAAEATDADAARRVVEALRREVGAPSRDPAPPAFVGKQPVLDAPARPVHEVPARPVHEVPPARQGRPFGYLVAVGVVALLAVVVILFVVRNGGPSATAQGVTAFATGDYVAAEGHFQSAVRADSGDVTALLYLGRIYRRDARFRESAAVLGSAADRAPDDPDVRRELGNLFMDLERPTAAAQQFDRARELAPANALNWIGLIRALRAAGDPQAEVWLERAPPEVRAALTSGRPAR
jgi:tetratricopeptide (TPR) repeat protein